MQRKAIFPDRFVPEDFFIGRTTGAGVCYGPLGRLVQRCFIETEGARDPASDTVHFDEVYTFDDGRTDKLQWAIGRDAAGRLIASELTVVGKPHSELHGPVWRVRFRRLTGRPGRGVALNYDAEFTWVAANVVMKQVKVTLFGVTLGRMIGFHRCIPHTLGPRTGVV